MKKLLLASTALVGMVGAAAAAEIKLSGYAEIGINGGNGVPGTPYETQFHNDWQVNFDFSGAMDSGVEFGGRVQIEETNGPGRINGGLYRSAIPGYPTSLLLDADGVIAAYFPRGLSGPELLAALDDLRAG